MTLLSLFPGLLEEGLAESACIVPADTPDQSPEPSLAQPAPEVISLMEMSIDTVSNASFCLLAFINSCMPHPDSIQ